MADQQNPQDTMTAFQAAANPAQWAQQQGIGQQPQGSSQPSQPQAPNAFAGFGSKLSDFTNPMAFMQSPQFQQSFKAAQQAQQPQTQTPQANTSGASANQPVPTNKNTPAGDPNWGQSLPPGIGNPQQAMTATAAFRNSPDYQSWLAKNGLQADTTGSNGGNPLTASGQPAKLTDAQQSDLLKTMQNAGIGISENSWHVDQNGQIAKNDSHLLRNILIGAGIGGSLLIPGVGEAVLGGLQSAGSGIAGLFGGGGSAAGSGIAASEAAGAEGAAAAGSGVGLGGIGTGGLIGGAGAGAGEAGGSIAGLLGTTAIPGGTTLGSAAGAGALGSLAPATTGLDLSGAIASGGLSGAPGGFDITPGTQVSAAEPTTTTGASTMADGSVPDLGAVDPATLPGGVTPQGIVNGLPGSVAGNGINSPNLIQRIMGNLAKGAAGQQKGGSNNTTNGSDISSLLGSLGQGIQNNRLQTGSLAGQYDKAAVDAQDSANRARASALKQLASSNYLLNGGYRGGQNTIQLNGKQVTIPQLLQAPDPASAAQKVGAANLQNTANATLAPGGTVSPIPFSSYGTPGTGERLAQAGSAITGLLPTVGKIFGWF